MVSSRTPSPRTAPRRLLIAVGIAAVTAVAAIAPTISSTAATTAATGAPGWVRLAHLSPDTTSVDVKVSSSSGQSTLFALNGVAYGAVSPYEQLPGGSYTVTMVPAGSSASTSPLLSAVIKVTPGTASTVAAFGSNRKLTLKTFTDDLTPPPAGSARVRLIQASTKVPTVDVLTAQGLSIAKSARAGSATSYASVPAGNWSLAISGRKVSQDAQVDLAAGTVSTLLVLDDPDGLTIRPVLDSAATAAAPVGGVNTGGGYLASKGLTGPLKATTIDAR